MQRGLLQLHSSPRDGVRDRAWERVLLLDRVSVRVLGVRLPTRNAAGDGVGAADGARAVDQRRGQAATTVANEPESAPDGEHGVGCKRRSFCILFLRFGFFRLDRGFFFFFPFFFFFVFFLCI
jgi:hypothetical protein